MNFIKDIKKVIKYILLITIGLVIGVVTIYFIAPKWVEDTAVELLFPTVTIEDQHRNRFSIEVPQVYEFMYIACSLTETFRSDDKLIGDRTPEYLQEVDNHFRQFSSHPLVTILEDKLKENPYSQLQPAIRLFSMNYNIDKSNQFQKNEVFHVNPIIIKLFKSKIFYYPDYIDELEDFAEKTDFYQFYEDHSEYYERLKSKYQKLTNPSKMWQWLEKRFPERYNSYRIIFSPLTGGFHNTIPGLKESKSDLKQTWMFISPPPLKLLDTLSNDELSLLSSKTEREVFTEIDHNYVNPISDLYINEIEKAIPNFRVWK